MEIRSYYTKVQAIRSLAAKIGITSAEQLGEGTGLSNKPVLKAWNGREPVSLKTLVALAQKLGLGDDYNPLVDWDRSMREQQDDDEHEEPVIGGDDEPPVFDPSRKPQQDIKVVVNDPGIRDRLLTHRDLPTFLEAFEASAMVTTVDDAHKDHPLLRNTDYNHFLQPSAVVTLAWKNKVVTLACHRGTEPLSPHNIHTTGRAILFAADPIHNLSNGCFSAWLRQARRTPGNATGSLLRGSQCILAEILKNTIDLRKFKARFEPLCIITNDQRSGGHNRVYTQYVFRATISVSDRNIDRFVGTFQTKRPLHFCRLEDECTPADVFVSDSKKPNFMDQLAWQTIYGEGTVQPLNDGKARCHRGFRIV